MNSSDRKFESDLIKAVFQFDCIYSKKHPNYKSRPENDASWLEVSTLLLKPIIECMDKWHFLFQIFIHFSRLETRFGYDLLCSQWCHYELFKEKQSEMPSSYSELIAQKTTTRKRSSKEYEKRSNLIFQIELRSKELMERSTSCERRQEIWSDISKNLKRKYRYSPWSVIDWQTMWWEIKEELLEEFTSNARPFKEEHLRLIHLFRRNNLNDPNVREKFSTNCEFDENVSESTCIKCSSNDSDLEDGLCNNCCEVSSNKCNMCSNATKSTCTLNTKHWRLHAKSLLPKSFRNREKIHLCRPCHLGLNKRASYMWKVCRVCGENNHPLENLMQYSFEDSIKIFQTVTGYSICLSDGLPCFICIRCREGFMDFVRFYVIFSNTQTELQKIREKFLIDEKLPGAQSNERSRSSSKRVRLQAEKEKYFAMSTESRELKKEISLEDSESSSDKASQRRSEEGGEMTSEQSCLFQETSSNTPQNSESSRREMSNQDDPSHISTEGNDNKRKRRNSSNHEPPSSETHKSRPQKVARNNENPNSVGVEENNAQQALDIDMTDESIPRRKRIINISEFSIEDFDGLEYLLTSKDVTKISSTSALRKSKSCDSNDEGKCVKIPITDTNSDIPGNELEGETDIPADAEDLVLDLDDTSSTCNATEARRDSLAKSTSKLKQTKPEMSRRNSVLTKITSNAIRKQLNPKTPSSRLINKEKRKEFTTTNTTKQPVCSGKPLQSQPVIDLEGSNDEQSRETPERSSSPNQLLKGLLNRNVVEITVSPIALPLNVQHPQTASLPLTEKINKVNVSEIDGPVKNPDMDSNSLKPKVTISSLEQSALPLSNCDKKVTSSKSSTKLTTSSSSCSIPSTGLTSFSEKNKVKPVKAATSVTRSSEQSVISSQKPCTNVITIPSVKPPKLTTSLKQSNKSSSIPGPKPNRSSKRIPVLPVRFRTRFLEPPVRVCPSSKPVRSSEKSEISTTSLKQSNKSSSIPSPKPNRSSKRIPVPPVKFRTRFLEPPVRVCPSSKPVRSSEKSEIPPDKPNQTTMTASSEQCAVAPVKPSTRIFKRDKKLLGEMLRKCLMSESVSPAEAVGVSSEMRKDCVLSKPTNSAQSTRVDMADNVQSEEAIQSTIRSSHSTTKRTNTSQEPNAVIIRDASPLGKPIASNRELHSNPFTRMFLPDIVQSTEIQLHTDIALHKTLLPDDEDYDDGDLVDVQVIEEVAMKEAQNNTEQVRHLHQSSLIDSVVERSFRTQSSFPQIQEVFPLNDNERSDRDETSDL